MSGLSETSPAQGRGRARRACSCLPDGQCQQDASAGNGMISGRKGVRTQQHGGTAITPGVAAMGTV